MQIQSKHNTQRHTSTFFVYLRHLISEASKFCWRARISFCWRYLISQAWQLDSSLHSRSLSNASCKESISSVNQANSSCWRRAKASIWSARFSCWTACLFATDTYTSFSETSRLKPANFVSFFLELVFFVVDLVEIQDRSSRRDLHIACYANKFFFLHSWPGCRPPVELIMFLFLTIWPGYWPSIGPHQYLSVFGFLTTWAGCRPLI